jgi:hypothetical protein
LQSRCLPSVTDNGLKYNLKPCIPVYLANDAGHIALYLPQIPENHPNHEGTVFSIFMLRTDRTSGHYHLDEMVNYFCHMSSVRGTSDGRGPVTRTRVPDRDEQGKPSEDARRGRCHPLEAGIYPCGCHRYRDTQLPSTKYQVGQQRQGQYADSEHESPK